MAAPQSTTVQNLSGVYDLNKKLSDPTEALLKMQGVSWVVRQAAAYSAITITMKQYSDSNGAMHIDAEQASTGGIKSSEERVLDWEWKEKEDKIWGKVKGRARVTKLSAIDCDSFLKEGWSGDDVIENEVESISDTWTVTQIWGFAEVEGARRHVRRVYAKKGKTEHRIRLVYDFKE